MVIDTTNERLEEINKKRKKELVRVKKEQGEYTSSDIALVRVTDHLPVNGYVPSLSKVPFVAKMNNLAYRSLASVLMEEGKDIEEAYSLAKEATPLSTQYRSSVHFCLNGVVSSHMQGNFDDNPFVVIEPFKEHENDENILAVRGEDTYFKDGVELSKKAIILVDEKYKNQVEENNLLDSNNIIYYKGDRSIATETVLLSMGIVPEVIGKDYIIESDTSEYIRGFINSKNYPTDKHCVSKSYMEDDQKTLELWERYGNQFYTYLYLKADLDIEKHKSEIEILSSAASFDDDAKKIVTDIIKTIGVEEYKGIVNEYNTLITEKIKKGDYPTNDQILDGELLTVSQKDKTI